MSLVNMGPLEKRNIQVFKDGKIVLDVPALVKFPCIKNLTHASSLMNIFYVNHPYVEPKVG